jgi:hypothetical protein
MKKTLRVLALATTLTLSFWATNADADQCGIDYRSCNASCSPEDSLCYQNCQCFLVMCRGWQNDC